MRSLPSSRASIPSIVVLLYVSSQKSPCRLPRRCFIAAFGSAFDVTPRYHELSDSTDIPTRYHELPASCQPAVSIIPSPPVEGVTVGMPRTRASEFSEPGGAQPRCHFVDVRRRRLWRSSSHRHERRRPKPSPRPRRPTPRRPRLRVLIVQIFNP